MKHLRFLLALASLVLVSGLASAQASIDKVINEIEKKPNVEYVAYNERRNPVTKKVYKSSKVIPVKDAKTLNKLVEAFKKEAGNSTSYEITRNRVYRIIFVKGTDQRAYTLVKQGQGTGLLTVEMINDANRPKGGSRADGDYPTQGDMDAEDFDLFEIDGFGGVIYLPSVSVF